MVTELTAEEIAAARAQLMQQRAEDFGAFFLIGYLTGEVRDYAAGRPPSATTRHALALVRAFEQLMDEVIEGGPQYEREDPVTGAPLPPGVEGFRPGGAR